MTKSGSSEIKNCKQIHQASRIFITLLVLVESVYVIYWITSHHDVPEQMQRLNKVQHKWQCRFCHLCRQEILLLDECESCDTLLGCHPPPDSTRKRWSNPQQCLKKKEFESNVTKIINDVFSKQEEGWGINEMKNISHYLKRVERKLYPKRFLVHWYLDQYGNEKEGGNDWTTITKYVTEKQHDRILPGFTDTYHKGGVRVPRNGLYLIITRLTFSCVKKSKLPQVISVQTFVHETEIYQRKLMSEDETVRCMIDGDVTTMYSSGLFRLAGNNVIYIRYNSSSDVILSTDLGSTYKSNIGVMWIGLS